MRGNRAVPFWTIVPITPKQRADDGTSPTGAGDDQDAQQGDRCSGDFHETTHAAALGPT